MIRSLALALVLLAPSALRSQEPQRVEVSLDPIEDAGPFVRRLRLRSNRSQEVVRDRRLLVLTVRPLEGRRRYRCVHPLAPRRAAGERVASMAAGETYDEWVDLRMYCWGAALTALRQGAVVEVSYGFRSRGRHRWVAREQDERRPPHRITGAQLRWSATDQLENDASVNVRLAPTTSRGWPTLRVRVTGRGRVYLRDDLWSFVVTGPLGRVECVAARQPVVPIIDFFVRLGRRPRRATLDASYYCPEGTFGVEGVYEVTPRLELVYDGEAYDIEAVTGTFEGPAAPLRVLRPGAPYVEQRVEDLGSPNREATGV